MLGSRDRPNPSMIIIAIITEVKLGSMRTYIARYQHSTACVYNCVMTVCSCYLVLYQDVEQVREKCVHTNLEEVGGAGSMDNY